MDYPNRKPMRLKDYDYSQNGAYFITICTKDRQPLLWENVYMNTEYVGADIIRPNDVKLNEYGKIVETAILSISKYYPNCNVDKYVIMPEHIHIILMLNECKNGRMVSAPTKSIKTIIGQMKRWVSKEIGVSIWQKSYYDHIIRDENDYLTKWRYIENNPLKRLECEVNPNDKF